jgi:hypothetical protein
MKFDIRDGLNFLIAAGGVPKLYQRVCLVFAERRGLLIIFRTTMNVFLDKRTEVMQTLLSMIEPIENVRGCLSCHVFRDIEEKNVFSLIEEWETRKPGGKKSNCLRFVWEYIPLRNTKG